jgi:hypothetical protein
MQPIFVDVVLTDGAIKNGYLDLKNCPSGFFPPDSIGTRSGDRKGRNVEFRFNGSTAHKDVRFKSEHVLSPRTRFGAYFRNINARPGAVIRCLKLAEGIYELQPL